MSASKSPSIVKLPRAARCPYPSWPDVAEAVGKSRTAAAHTPQTSKETQIWRDVAVETNADAEIAPSSTLP